MARILVVDDEARMATLIQRELADRGHSVETAGDGQAALDRCSRDPFDLVITDLKMPGMDGLELLRRLREGTACPEVVLMTAYASAQTAVEAMKEGAWDYLVKPFEMDELIIMVDRITERDQLKAENAVLREQVHGSDATIIGDSEAIHHVLDLVGKVADQETTVLIQGESGTGKELVARAIHAASARASGPFVAVNCGAIPETLLESELFGHEKGAFTGADARRKGRFEIAAAGTLFLDEVGELSLQAQVKLLRVLQERVIERVGGGGEVPVDVRVLAATNQDLARMVAEGRFREDLYYRLNVFPIHIPPLRDRREDIAGLARHLAAGLDRPARLSEAAYPVLADYDWPGNVRELENIIERAAILAGPGSSIGPEHLTGLTGTQAHGSGGDAGDPVRIPEAGVDLEELEKQHILEALRKTDGNKSEAARLLHMSRRRLYSRLDHHGIPY